MYINLLKRTKNEQSCIIDDEDTRYYWGIITDALLILRHTVSGGIRSHNAMLWMSPPNAIQPVA